MAQKGRHPLTAQERRQLEKQRKKAARDAQKYRKEREKEQKKSGKSSEKQNPKNKSRSKIEQRINEAPKNQRENLSREELYIKDSEEKIRNMKPRAYDDGYYIDEYGERERQKRRVQEIRQQEKEVIKRPKKPLTSKQIKRRRIFTSVLICIAVIIVGLTLCLTVLFKTEKITVEGDKYYGKDQIIAFGNVSYQQNIFLACMFGTPEAIVENLPYVEEAKIEFTIPDTVTIKVTDAVPSYVIRNGDKFLLISAKGRILDEVSENPDKLPELTSDALQSTERGDYVTFTDNNVPSILDQISKCLHDNEFSGITGIDIKDTARIKLIYDNRITVIIGLPEDIDYKIRTAMSIISEKLDPNNSGTVAGTLDVSSCNTTKMSRYNPNETIATTAPSTFATEETTAPAEPDTAADSYDYGYPDQSGEDGGDSWDYSDSGDGWDYSDNSYDTDYSDDSGGTDTYGDGGYSDGYTDENNGDTSENNDYQY